MQLYTNKQAENKQQAVSVDLSASAHSSKSAFYLQDNRYGSVVQKKQGYLIDNRPLTVVQRMQMKTLENKSVSTTIIQKKTNKTGLPDNLKSGIENLSGHSMDDVKVHYHSAKPAQLNAYAYAQGTDIHLASGQEKHLPHEAWHVVQQKQGRVKPTLQMKGKINVNDDHGLEKEADVMGKMAAQTDQGGHYKSYTPAYSIGNTVQRVIMLNGTILTEAGALVHIKKRISGKINFSDDQITAFIKPYLSNKKQEHEIDFVVAELLKSIKTPKQGMGNPSPEKTYSSASAMAPSKKNLEQSHLSDDIDSEEEQVHKKLGNLQVHHLPEPQAASAANKLKGQERAADSGKAAAYPASSLSYTGPSVGSPKHVHSLEDEPKKTAASGSEISLDDIKDAIIKYSQEFYKIINAYLRNKEGCWEKLVIEADTKDVASAFIRKTLDLPFGGVNVRQVIKEDQNVKKLNRSLKSTIKLMDTGFKHFKKNEGDSGIKSLIRGEQVDFKRVDQYKTGNSFTSESYLSFAEGEKVDANYKKNHRLIIHDKKSINIGLDLKKHNLTAHGAENEVLFPRGTKFKVTSNVEKDGVTIVTLEVDGPINQGEGSSGSAATPMAK